ncbi:MAG: class I SAM-dependent methyltransferase [Candidatus Aenigmarchaeota archaeon]|nr:class I SAM-dependent methyltransferase [Candidatus Aenigmarchaeota archaeon]
MAMKTNLAGIIKLYDGIYSEKKPFFSLNYHWDTKRFSSLVKRGSTVLDAGCGIGKASQLLEREGYKVIGIDVNRKAIQRARRGYPDIEFQICGLSDLSRFKNSTFDAIFCRRVLGDLYRIGKFEKALAELARVLKKGGLIYTRTYIVIRTDFTFEDRKFTVKYFQKEFGKHFKILESKTQYSIRRDFWGKQLKLVGKKL